MMPNDPFAGGTVLRRPALQSPTYSPGVSGWIISADGSAEFNNLTIRGTFAGTNFEINTSGAFFYSGAPTLGNLIVSIASAAGTDAHGNAYPQGINVTTGTISGTTISGSTITGTTFDGTNFEINATGAFFYSGTPALGNLVTSITPGSTTSGTDAHGNTYYGGVTSYTPNGSGGATTAVALQSGAVLLGPPANFFSPFPQPGLIGLGAGSQSWQSGGTAGGDAAAIIHLLSGNANSTPSNPQINVNGNIAVAGALTLDNQAAPSTPTGAATLYANSTGAPQSLEPSGSNRVLDRSQANNSTATIGNTAAETAITNVWTIAANEMTNSSVYEIETAGNCVFESQTLTFAISRDGAAGGAAETIGAAFVSAGTTVNWWMKARIICTATGVSGSVTVQLIGGLAVQGSNLLSGTSGNTIAFVGPPITSTVDTTASHTWAITGKWGGTAVGLTLSAKGSTITKKSS